ncbi:SagB/ThcOx family dehydrogenase [Candidatus Peregrinibacteria bacterium]|nr:SagB/ThcOx family dehydrogenase [Candidatus Peregrinibacteria bacterium]
MKKIFIILPIAIYAGAAIFFIFLSTPNMEKENNNSPDSKTIELPEPEYDSDTSIEEAILNRRSIRNYKNEPLTISEISQILWAAQGITDEDGKRAAPSAGALYPIEIYLVAGDVEELSPGIYKYNPGGHEIIRIAKDDVRKQLSSAALGQNQVEDAAADIVITAVYERTESKYGERAERYVHMEVGHIGQNIYLQCVALNLGTVSVGAFDDMEVKEIINMEKDEEPLYILPIGVI